MNSQIGVIVAAIVGVFVAVILGVSIADESFMIVGIIGLTLVLLFFVLQQRLLTASVIILVSSGLTIPQLQGKLNLFYLAAVALAIFVIIHYAFQQRSPITFSAAHGWLVAFGLVILGTILFRGAGLRMLGDEKWGGMFYVQLFICMSLVFTIPRLNLTPSMWRPTLTASAGMAFLPVFAGFAAMGGIGVLLLFFQADSQSASQAAGMTLGTDVQITRYFALGTASFALFTCMLYFIPIRDVIGKRAALALPVIVMCLALAGMSGFRGSLLNIVMLTAVLLFLTKSLTPSRCLVALGVGGAFYAIALAFATDFPLPVQRMLSLLPGVEVAGVAEQDATSTYDWRLILWQRGLATIPDYWLVGKGYAFSSSEMLAAHDPTSGLFDPTDWAVVTSAYHQGLLSLLIGLGLPGLITGMLAYYLFLKRHLSFLRRQWFNQPLQSCHLVTTAVFLVGFINFIFVYGDVQVSFPMIFIHIAILEGLWAANASIEPKANADNAPVAYQLN
jgi:hypothetical protein